MLLLFLLLWKNTQQKQLKQGRAYFGPQWRIRSIQMEKAASHVAFVGGGMG